MKRPIRRAALLNYPGVSCSREYVQQVKREGFTDIAVGLLPDHKQFTGQGYGWEQIRQLAEWAEGSGMGLVLFTGYQKYREDFVQRHPERGMVCVGGAGKAVDSDSLVVRNWLCPFQPENKAEYLSLLKKAAQLPPLREIHLNDEASIGFPNGEIGCYCNYCTSEYERRFGHPPPRKPGWASEEWWQWVEYRMEAWTSVHAYFRAEIKKLRPDVAVGIQHSSKPVLSGENPYLSGVDIARDGVALDVLCTDPYHHAQFPLYPYRPMRRILTEGSRSLAGATVKRSMNIYPQAWAAPLQCVEVTHRDGFMVGTIPFAMGAESITPYCYELMKIIPGFFEGLQEARALIPYFEKTRPYRFATVLRPVQTEIYGYPEQGFGKEVMTRWPDVMNQVGLPWRWVYDERLSDAVDELTGPVILPEAHCLTQEQRAILQSHAEAGKGLLWVGRTPVADWPGQGPCPPPSGEAVVRAELTAIRPDHPLLEGVGPLVILESAFSEPGVEGETVAEVEGRPALVVREMGKEREVWLAGVPVYNYVKPGGHGSVRTPTGGIALLRNILRWLAREDPLARLWPYPPENAYGNLRPWDRRDVPTMELFPMVGDGCLVCLIFNYYALAYRTNLEMRTPEGRKLRSLTDLYTGEDLLTSAEVMGCGITLPVEMPAEKEFLAVELSW